MALFCQGDRVKVIENTLSPEQVGRVGTVTMVRSMSLIPSVGPHQDIHGGSLPFYFVNVDGEQLMFLEECLEAAK